jgi:benzoate-CoA ligase family protein
MNKITGYPDYKRLLREWTWEIPEHFNIGVDCVDKHAATAGRRDRICLFWENERGEKRTFTFGQMKSLSDRFGNVLRALGLGKGDRLILRLPNVPEFHVAFLGALKIGALPVPCSVMFRAHEMEYRIADSGAAALVTTDGYAADIDTVRGKCPSLKHVIVVGRSGEGHLDFEKLMSAAPEKFEPEKTRAEDPAFICYTSGTTGVPKGAVHAHRWLIGNDPGTLFWQDVRESDIVAHTGQLNWIFTFSNGFVFAWRHGAATLIYDGPFRPEKWFGLIEKYRTTILVSVPTAYRVMLSVKDAEKKFDLGALRHCISAGEPLTPEAFHEWERRFGLKIHDGLGMTEHTVYLTSMKGLDVRPGSCGLPQPGHPCAVLDEQCKEAPPGVTGVLATRRGDPSLFIGYWNKPELTDQAFRGGWHISGDMLYRAEDGYYYFSGRNDDLIMSAGYRISPFEVESALNMHPAVMESAAVAGPDSLRGVIVKAFVVLKEGYEPSEYLVKEIQTFVKNEIAAYKYPRAVEFVSELPKTSSGKIRRKLLRERECKEIDD